MADKDIKLAIRANVKDAQDKLKDVAEALEELEKEAKRAGDSMEEAGKDTNSFKNALGSLKGGMFASLAAANLATEAISAMVGVLKDAAAATIKLGLETEQIQAKFGAMRNNLMQASEAYQIFNDVGRDTNYDMNAVNEMGIKLINLGYNAQQAAEMIRIVSDTAAGLGKGQEGATALMDSLNRMRSTGQFTIRDMKSLQEQGIKVEQAFAQAFGTDTQHVMEMVKDDAIDGKDAFEILANYMQNEFAGAMADSKNNVTDAWGDLSGNIQTICGEIGSSIFEAFNQSAIIQQLIGITQDFIDLIRSDTEGVFHDLKAVAGEVLDFIGGAFHGIVQAVKLVIIIGNEMYQAFKSYGAQIASALEPILKPLAAVYKLVTGVLQSLGKEVSSGIDASWGNMLGGGYYDATDTYGTTDAVKYKGNGNYRAKAGESGNAGNGGGGQASAYDGLKTKAEQVAASITSAWQNMFKTKDELVDIWYDKEKAALDKAGLDAEEYNKLLGYLDEMRKAKHAEIADAITKKTKEEAEKRAKAQEDAHKKVISYWDDMAKSAGSAFAQCITEGKSFGSAFKEIVKQIIQQLMQALVYALLLSAFGGGGFGSFGTNFQKGLFGKKDGGLIHAATGGRLIGGGSGRSDSIPAMLSNGEFVVNAASTRQNLPMLEAINDGTVNTSEAIGGTQNITLNISAIDATGFSDLLNRGGLNAIKQALTDDDRMFNGTAGVW